MKISIINDYPPNVGVTSYSYNLYLNLRRHSLPIEFYQFLFDYQIKNISKDINIIKGVNFKSYKFNLLLNRLLHFNIRALKNIESDIIIFSCCTLAPLIKHYKNKKTIMMSHDLYGLFYKGRSRFLNWMTKRLYLLQTEVDFMITPSEYTKNDLIKYLNVDKNKIYVVYPAIDEKIFYPSKENIRKKLGFKDNDVVLLNVAFDTPNKNIKTVLEVLNKLPENFKLIRVGKNLSSLKIVKKLNLEHRIKFFEDIDSKYLGDIYRSSDIFIYPSYYEGFGIPVAEAMASGIPVIVSNKTTLPEVVGDAGIIIDPFDVDKIVNEVLELSENKEKYNLLKEKVLKQSKRYSFENQYESFMKMFKNIID